MDKQKKQLIIVGILVAILLFSVMGSFKKKPGVRAVASAPAPSIAAAPQSASTAAPASMRADEKKMNAQLERAKLAWGRDPFVAPSEKEYQIGELELKGISFDEEKGGYAFINNDIVKKGDAVGDYEVVDIEKDRVLLKKGNQSFYLVFPGQE